MVAIVPGSGIDLAGGTRARIEPRLETGAGASGGVASSTRPCQVGSVALGRRIRRLHSFARRIGAGLDGRRHLAGYRTVASKPDLTVRDEHLSGRFRLHLGAGSVRG